MRVFRVECRDGNGPYTGHGTWRIGIGEAHCKDLVRWPGMREDIPMWEPIRDVAGCPTLEALVEWFEGWWPQLREKNCRIVEYELHIDDIKFGRSGKQLCFPREKAKLISRRRINV
ncbi:MAG: hypothetical protein ACXABY_17720 [Candidatus Thorarchaeota archaeon]|jgi:hypothetical protein